MRISDGSSDVCSSDLRPMKLRVPEEIVAADQLGRVHLIGIGGAGLSGIARILLARGITVSGSDGTDSPVLDALRELGARVHLGHAAERSEECSVGERCVGRRRSRW